MTDKKIPQDDEYFNVQDDDYFEAQSDEDYFKTLGDPVKTKEQPDEKLVEVEEETAMSEIADTPPESQVMQDIKEAGFTPEEAIAAAKAAQIETTKKDKLPAEKLVAIAKFRWILLFVLSLASVTAWAVEAEMSGRPYNWLAWGFLAATVVLTILTVKFLRLPTRGGLAALCWSGTFLISALYGPQETIFGHVPAALSWSGLLTLIMLWTAVAIWRKVGRYKVVDLILAAILIYAALSPLWSLVDNIVAGYALSLHFSTLNASPAFITNSLPWVIWPMTICLIVILPLAALFALWDQFSALRRRGGRHGGNFFLALAFLGLIPYGFLAFDQAVKENMDIVRVLRSVYPAAAPWAREGMTVTPAVAAAPPTAAPAEVVANPEPSPPITQTEESETAAAITAEPAAPPVTEETPSAAVETSETAVLETTMLPAVSPEKFTEMTKRLETTEQRLNEALKRLDELEKKEAASQTEEAISGPEEASPDMNGPVPGQPEPAVDINPDDETNPPPIKTMEEHADTPGEANDDDSIIPPLPPETSTESAT